MIMQNTFSLIIATYGRYKEIDCCIALHNRNGQEK